MLGHVPFAVVYVFSKQKKRTAQLTVKGRGGGEGGGGETGEDRERGLR